MPDDELHAIKVKARKSKKNDKVKLSVVLPKGMAGNFDVNYVVKDDDPDTLPQLTLKADTFDPIHFDVDDNIDVDFSPISVSAIYGVDDRQEVSQIQSYFAQQNARAVCGIMDISQLDMSQSHIGIGYMAPSLFSWQRSKGRTLSPSTRFLHQPTAALKGTAFLVADDVIATAAHCLLGFDPDTWRFAFDYAIPGGQASPGLSLPGTFAEASHVISQGSGAEDWALVKLKAPVSGVWPVTLSPRRHRSEGESVYVIGHPLGLPKKYADNGTIVNNTATTHFKTNLDTFAGNSGSPVFDSTNNVIGILVRGQRDFEEGDDGFWHMATHHSTSHQGEDCTRISYVIDAMEDHIWSVA